MRSGAIVLCIGVLPVLTGALSGCPATIPSADVKTVAASLLDQFDALDTDADLYLTYNEARAGIPNLALNAFYGLDANQNNRLSMQELLAAFEEPGQELACELQVSCPSGAFTAEGGTGTLQIYTGSKCVWMIDCCQSWISFQSETSGMGSATVAFTVEPSQGPFREADLTISGEYMQRITQAEGCDIQVLPESHSFGKERGSGSVTVRAGSGCAWQAWASDPWIRVTEGSRGVGRGEIQYVITENEGSARTGSIEIDGMRHVISQAGQ